MHARAEISCTRGQNRYPYCQAVGESTAVWEEFMLKVGLLGAGRIGQVHAVNIANNPRSTLAAVSDVNTPAAEKLAAQHGAVRGHAMDRLHQPLPREARRELEALRLRRRHQSRHVAPI